MRRSGKRISPRDVEKDFTSEVPLPRPGREGGAMLTAGDIRSLVKHGSPYFLKDNEEGTSFGKGWGN